MESFKIEHFLRENPGKSFPPFQTLNAAECAKLKAAVADMLGLPERDAATILDTLRDKAVHLTEVNADSEEFLLAEVLKSCGITPKRDIFVNWDRFDTIDRIALEHFSTHFGDIYYAGPDDIEVFDASLEWFMLVNHEGEVSLWKR